MNHTRWRYRGFDSRYSLFIGALLQQLRTLSNTVCGLCLLCGLGIIAVTSYAAPDHWHVVRHITLDKMPHSRLSATVEFDSGEPGGFGSVYVVFRSQSAAQRQKRVIYHGQGMSGEIKIEAQDFVHRGRKQLFVSCEMGEVYNVIYDYDGKRVRKVYDSGGGRLQVTPVKIKHGAWELIEEWAIFHYNGDGLGVAFKTTDNGVRRTLVWRHGQYVPKFPGPTIVR